MYVYKYLKYRNIFIFSSFKNSEYSELWKNHMETIVPSRDYYC